MIKGFKTNYGTLNLPIEINITLDKFNFSNEKAKKLISLKYLYNTDPLRQILNIKILEKQKEVINYIQRAEPYNEIRNINCFPYPNYGLINIQGINTISSSQAISYPIPWFIRSTYPWSPICIPSINPPCIHPIYVQNSIATVTSLYDGKSNDDIV